MVEPILRVDHLSKVYEDGTHALSDVSFEVARGEFLVIIGLSGSGKSTLLRCINRLVEPTSGRVAVGGRDVTSASRTELREIRRGIGMIFQQFNLVRRASVLTNVLAGDLGYVPPAWAVVNYFPPAAVGRAMGNLERVGIADKAYGRASALSGGQQQRVAIARALMQRPRLFLADEPVASLDPALSHSILKYLEDLNRNDGMTILCCLHFLSLARRYGTRILALKDGRIVFDGRPDDIDDARFHEIYGEQAEEVEIR